MKIYDRDQIRQIVLDRFGKALGAPGDDPTGEFDRDLALREDKPGRPHAAWHLTEFAKVDDLIEEGELLTKSCEQVLSQLPEEISYYGNATSFRHLYDEFKRTYEVTVRKKMFSEALFANELEEAVEQCFRLSKVVCIKLTYKDWI